MSKFKKVVLAYSGGLDTSISIQWLLENRAEEVIAVAVDLGQKEDLEAVRQKALKVGASQAFVIDARKEFVENFVWPSLKANATYEFNYPLATAIGRPLIAKVLNDIALKTNADCIAHGCTAKGNDQVRFEVSWQALNPNLTVIAPPREWGELCDRGKAIDYADKHGIPISSTKKSPYSIDLNLWGRSVECGVLEDPWVEPPEDAYALTNPVETTPNEAKYIEIEFREGVPIKLDGVEYNAIELIEELNSISGLHGIGRIDQIENRLVGIKSREVYEAPAATVLLKAHKEIEYLVNTKDTVHFKQTIDQKYSELIYNGLWFSPLREALDGFIEKTQRRVNGTIKLKLFKGNCVVVGRKSENALYNLELATYDEGDEFDHSAAPGFIKIFGLGVKTFYQSQSISQ
ncbi:MAG: argininosuccinate synthase [Candidatus Caenarcaniphilales bacterium]|nr:argininosuccinate synthase [Candidatus Caenarcaniphilales bacterium]